MNQIINPTGRTVKKVYRERKEVVPEIIIELVEEYQGSIPVLEILRLFDIPKSTYYWWKKRTVLDYIKYLQ